MIDDLLASKDPWKLVPETFLRLISKVAETPEACTAAEWTVFRVWSLLGEVSNGGFDQYFFNSAGNHAAETLDDLRVIGDVEALGILREAMALFPEPASPARDVRWRRWTGCRRTRRRSSTGWTPGCRRARRKWSRNWTPTSGPTRARSPAEENQPGYFSTAARTLAAVSITSVSPSM